MCSMFSTLEAYEAVEEEPTCLGACLGLLEGNLSMESIHIGSAKDTIGNHKLLYR
jgi:hypothetical protein